MATKAAEPKTVMPTTLTGKGDRVRGFGALPEGFDPLTATDRQLAAHRLPRSTPHDMLCNGQPGTRTQAPRP